MVEKVSESGIDALINIDMSLDDRGLLEWISKKKEQKKNNDQSLSESALPKEMLVRLLNVPVIGGGVLAPENAIATRDASAMSDVGRSPLPFDKSDMLRRQAVQVAEKVKVITVNRKDAAVSGTDPLSSGRPALSTPVQSRPAVAMSRPDAENVNMARQPLIPDPVAASVSTSPQQAPARPISRSLEDISAARVESQGGKQPEFISSQYRETNVKNQNTPMAQQQRNAQVSHVNQVVKDGADARLLEVDYTFQRWSGDHSVKVTVPTQAAREANITLLPSDSRAAEMLSRHMGHLGGLTPDLLPPNQERDEQKHQERDEQQQQQDEELE